MILRTFLLAIVWASLAPLVLYAKEPGPAQIESAIKTPDGADAKLTSTDPDYGYSKAKPIKVGGDDDLSGPAAERTYFRTLLDEAGKPVEFRRLGSFGPGPDGNILDGYQVTTSTGRTVTLYIDMYHLKRDPKKELAPKGFFKAK